MTTLVLNVKKKWFELVKSGKKKIEYREIKDYWTKRLKKDYDDILYVVGYPSDYTSDNSMRFIYSGYSITSINSDEVSYDDTLKELSAKGPTLVYAIPLRSEEEEPLNIIMGE